MRQPHGVPRSSSNKIGLGTFTLPRILHSSQFHPKLLLQLAAHHQCPLEMLTLSSNYPKSEGEQHCGPHPDEGLDDDDFYLNFLREVTHYPDDYHHGPSTAVNMLSPIQGNSLIYRVDDGPLITLTESPDFESRSSLGLSHNHQHLLVELVSFAEWPPPPPPLKLFRDVHDPLLTTVAPESPCNLFTNDQVRTHAPR